MNDILFGDLRFAGDGRGLTVLRDGRPVLTDAPLWRINTAAGTLTLAQMTAFSHTVIGDRIELYWTAPDTRITVTVRRDGDAYRFHIAVNTAADNPIDTVEFPRLTGFAAIRGEAGRDHLLLPYQTGWLCRDPIRRLLRTDEEYPFWLDRTGVKYENDYPAAYSYQYFAYYGEDTFGCYLATEDAGGYIKKIGFYPAGEDDMTFGVTQYPENMGETVAYVAPYDTVLRFFEGDWQTATAIYRAWAIRQDWCRETLREKGVNPLVAQMDLLRINHRNYDLGTRSEEFLDTAVTLARETGGQVGVHWYGWNHAEHDIEYPEYISRQTAATGWPEQLTALVDRLHEQNITAIPYVNARLWDDSTPSWTEENAARSILRDERGERYNEPWKPGRRLVPLCPSTPLWHRTVTGFGGYVTEHHFDGLYVDQVGSYNATLCFDRSHPHPRGGGRWWKDRYSAIMRSLRERAGAGKFFTTESCCEAYLRDFDMFLNLDTTVEPDTFFRIAGNDTAEAVPLFSMIYGNHAVCYGSSARISQEPALFRYNFTRNIVWGWLPTVEGVSYDDLRGENAPAALETLRRGVAFYKENKDLLLYGRPVCLPTLPVPSMTVGDGKITCPCVSAAVWEDENGGRSLLGCNAGESDLRFSYGSVAVEAPAGEFFRYAL